MRSSVLKAKLITLIQPENLRFQLAACGKAKKFSDRKNCAAVGQTLGAITPEEV